MVRHLSFVLLAGLLAGCAADSSDSPGSETDDISASSRTYVAIRKDTRECFTVGCGGWFVHDVNRVTLNEKYVSSLDFSQSGFGDDTIADVTDAPPAELVLRGKLGPVDGHGDPSFIISEAYRGLPGELPGDGATFYFAKDRDPQIQCFAAPCNEEIATKLNATATTPFTSLDVSAASQPFVDQSWVVGRALHHGGVVAGAFHDGAVEAGGTEKILGATQVYFRLPDDEGVCSHLVHHCSAGSPSYTRDENMCKVFDACVSTGVCPQYLPACADGYTLSSWRSSSRGCPTFACDPTFIVQ